MLPGVEREAAGGVHGPGGRSSDGLELNSIAHVGTSEPEDVILWLTRIGDIDQMLIVAVVGRVEPASHRQGRSADEGRAVAEVLAGGADKGAGHCLPHVSFTTTANTSLSPTMSSV